MEFKDRYVLGEGYPWADGIKAHYSIELCRTQDIASSVVELNFPEELWSRDLPKYRLVLERVDD